MSKSQKSASPFLQAQRSSSPSDPDSLSAWGEQAWYNRKHFEDVFIKAIEFKILTLEREK